MRSRRAHLSSAARFRSYERSARSTSLDTASTSSLSVCAQTQRAQRHAGRTCQPVPCAKNAHAARGCCARSAPGWRPAWRARPPTAASAPPAACAAPSANDAGQRSGCASASGARPADSGRQRRVSGRRRTHQLRVQLHQLRLGGLVRGAAGGDAATQRVSTAHGARVCSCRRGSAARARGRAPRARQAQALHLQLQHGAVDLIQRLSRAWARARRQALVRDSAGHCAAAGAAQRVRAHHRLGGDLHLQLGSSLVHQVDSLVRQKAATRARERGHVSAARRVKCARAAPAPATPHRSAM
jgi:hypothetical protein